MASSAAEHQVGKASFIFIDNPPSNSFQFSPFHLLVEHLQGESQRVTRKKLQIQGNQASKYLLLSGEGNEGVYWGVGQELCMVICKVCCMG